MSRSGVGPEQHRQGSEADATATPFQARGKLQGGQDSLGRGAEPFLSLGNCLPYPQVRAPAPPGPRGGDTP